MVKAFRIVAAAEAATFLVLIASVVSYRAFDGPDATGAIGPIHGIVFLAYAALAVQVREHLRWTARRTVFVIVAAVVPAGGFVVADRLTRQSAAPKPLPSQAGSDSNTAH